ncbi:hypothetical protein BHE74_00031137 [Ensete ventricosum]|nr:hypothetical protein BHE74_00031137 [Ensete ventricosum]
MTMNPKKGADDFARAKFDNPIRSNYHAPARSSSCEGHKSLLDVKETAVLSTAMKLGRSVDLKGSERSIAVVDLLSFDSEKELIADGVGKVPLLVGSDATVVVHKEDGLLQKNTSVEELRKPTH